MHHTSKVDRVVLLVMDGLRADATFRLKLTHLTHLASTGAATFDARTVAPSVTAAALTSLFTGVPPEAHGIGRQGFGVPTTPHLLRPLTQLLARASLPSSILAARIPLTYRWLSGRLAAMGGVEHVCFKGDGCGEILESVRLRLHTQRQGLIFMHWPDADRAGHEEGWSSRAYESAAREMDARLGDLLRLLGDDDAETLLIVCSDHGGGGERPDDHDSAHPDDTTIPILLSGPAVSPVALQAPVSLLDVPATVLWSLGLEVPESYAGRPLVEAFRRKAAAA